jgi:serine/threonine protein kinase
VEDGRRVGNHYLLARIGQGGMGDVYAAVKNGPGGFGKLLVLKVLRDSLAEDPVFLSMFMDEARLAARLSHPNIVQTYEVGVCGESHFIVMEHLDGQSLGAVLRRLATDDRPVLLRFALTALGETLSGLQHAHGLTDLDGRALGVVHRDVTPQNIFVTYDGQVKIVDFGIAKALDSNSETVAGTFKGKIGYVSPEQVRGEAVDCRADLYSVGVILWEVLAGHRMWRGLSEVAVVSRLTQRKLPDLPRLAEAVPGALGRICSRAVAADPADRFADAAALRTEIEAVLAELGGPLSRRRIGEMMSSLFTREMKEDRRQIEEELKAYGRASAVEASPAGNRDQIPRLGGGSAKDGEVTVRSGSRDPGTALATSESITVNYRLPRRLRRAARRPRMAIGLAAAVLVLGAAVGVLIGVDRRAPPVPDATSPASAHPAPLPPVTAPAAQPVVELTGEIGADAVLANDKRYLLRFVTSVAPGASLIIQKGTTILGDFETKGTLVIRPGARIIAEGTADEPIVFTSSRPPGQRRPGDWGGVVILGEAPVNLRDEDDRPVRGRVEGLIEGGEYGGGNPDDSSGTLRYVRIEYSGTEIAPNNEINGLTLAGVGRLTAIDHVQVRHVRDDCFEFFGGTVDARHLICHAPGDDGFDWDYGYTGRLQFVLLTSSGAGSEGAHGFEGDNDPAGSRNEPVSAPTIFNATLCGANVATVRDHAGMLLRNGTRGLVADAVVSGFATGLEVRGPGTRPDVRSTVFSENRRPALLPASPGKRRAGRRSRAGPELLPRLFGPERGNRLEDSLLSGCTRRDRQGYKPELPLTAGATAPPGDGFFDSSAAFLGAFRNESDNWDAGRWVVWDDN